MRNRVPRRFSESFHYPTGIGPGVRYAVPCTLGLVLWSCGLRYSVDYGTRVPGYRYRGTDWYTYQGTHVPKVAGKTAPGQNAPIPLLFA